MWSEKNKILDLECWIDLKSVPQSFIYGSPYLGAAAATQSNQNTQAGLAMQIPAAAHQLSHAAAIAAATSQFYEYQVSSSFFFHTLFGFLDRKNQINLTLFFFSLGDLGIVFLTFLILKFLCWSILKFPWAVVGYNHIHTTNITESNRSVAVLITHVSLSSCIYRMR